MSNTASRIRSWSGEAFNQVPESDNRIHSDDVARAYGFEGALVPGVTQSAYLIHPAVEAWGEDWLRRGFAHVKIESPLYDCTAFTVQVEEKADAEEGVHRYQAQLRNHERRCSVASVSLQLDRAPVPELRGDPIMDARYEPPAAEPEAFCRLQEQGCPATRFLWSADHHMASYLRQAEKMPRLFRTDCNDGGFANSAFLLGCANRHFAAVARMSPWVHLETRSQHYRPVALNTELLSEMAVVDLFNRKGHEFADCLFNLFDAASGECLCSIWQRAIYKMRPV